MQSCLQSVKMLQNQNIWWSLSFILVSSVYIVCLMPLDGPLKGPEFIDKVWHFGTYVIVMLWFSQLFEAHVHRRVLIGVVLMGLSIECLQALTPWRSFDVLDLGANMAGALAGWGLAVVGLHRLLARAEQRWRTQV